MELGRQLQRLGVDIIEAGFPATSPGDFRSVEMMARELKDCQIAALSGFKEDQIETTYRALKDAVAPRLHIVISTSDNHLENQLHMSRGQVIEIARDATAYCKRFLSDVEFSAMDATRSDPDFLCEVFSAAVASGATVINVPDTLGYHQPPQFADLVRYVMENVPGVENVGVSVHCHNDLGMATALSLAAVNEGAEQIECTINGVGERAGNASLEEIVMALRHAPRLLPGNDEHQHRANLAGKPHGQPVYGLRRTAQQGHCGRQCVCPLQRTAPGRDAQGAHDLRDHDAGEHRSQR